MTKPVIYRGYEIRRNDFDAHPDWRVVSWLFAHKDYDGPEDHRCGFAASMWGCINEIDEQI